MSELQCKERHDTHPALNYNGKSGTTRAQQRSDTIVLLLCAPLLLSQTLIISRSSLFLVGISIKGPNRVGNILLLHCTYTYLLLIPRYPQPECRPKWVDTLDKVTLG